MKIKQQPKKSVPKNIWMALSVSVMLTILFWYYVTPFWQNKMRKDSKREESNNESEMSTSESCLGDDNDDFYLPSKTLG